jgi:hypothetical protein
MIVRARTLLARARLLFYALRADHLRESPAEQRRESTRSEPRGLSAQIALYSCAAVARARASLWIAYGRRKFDESKHPRAPKGTPEGGRFVHAGAQSREFFVPESLQPWAEFVRSQYDEVPSRTTAELNLELNARLRELETATTDEERAHARLWCDRIQEALADRNFQDDDAPLKVKERVWAAQKKFAQLFAQRRILESWLSQSKRTILKSSDSVRSAQEKLAAVKLAMEHLAAVSGAKLPQANPIRDWSFEQKFAAAVDVALRSENLAPDIEAELRAAIEPANLARTGAAMAALAAAHAYPVAGVAADSILLGYAGVDGALLAHRLYLEIDSIQSETDLQSTAALLEKELASQAADKLIGLLTWGGGKGVASFHKNYKVTLDRAKVRRLSTGEMPLSPNPKNLIPIKIEKRKKGGTKQAQRGSASQKASRHKTRVTASGETVYPDGATLTNWLGRDVHIPKNHIMSLVDRSFKEPPIIRKGGRTDPRGFTDAERNGFLRGNDGGTMVTPHHRHQIPVRDGGVIDELPRHGHPENNVHLSGSPTRHPNDGKHGRNRSLFSGSEGRKLRRAEIKKYFVDKGNRLVRDPGTGLWIDPLAQ